jgi:DNA-binding XRE family transcriptional regulator/predicted nucleic acid-binding Zn ribbon protein
VNILQSSNSPNADESLGDYVKRLRSSLGLTQQELADSAGIHLQSVGKIERGRTVKLNSRSKTSLAVALQVPVEYLEAICRGTPVETVSQLKFCARCWTPGTPPNSLWMVARSKFCFLCGSALCERCRRCSEPITSIKHRFCPFCGTTYQEKADSQTSSE